MVIGDEPYRPITFDGARIPETLSLIRRAVEAATQPAFTTASRRSRECRFRNSEREGSRSRQRSLTQVRLRRHGTSG